MPETAADVAAYVDVMRHQGVSCPTCGQYAKVYRRKLNFQMARALIDVWKVGGTNDWVHVRTVVGKNRADEAKLRYWELIEEGAGRREDGGRAGFWRVTPAGEAFILKRHTVPQYALVYNGACIDHDGPLIYIDDALDTQFSYIELMGK